MFQILTLLFSYYILSNSIHNNFLIKNNNNCLYNLNNQNTLRETSNFQKIINRRIPFFNFHNIKHIDISNNFVNYNFDPYLVINSKTDVYIHIEKLYTRLPIFHIGVSFFNGYRTIRYDYRPFNDNGSYITVTKQDNATFKNNIVRSKTIYWCQIDNSLTYIDNCEKEIINRHPKYRLCFNDCRHYARRLTLKTANKPTPIWKLYKLWNSN